MLTKESAKKLIEETITEFGNEVLSPLNNNIHKYDRWKNRAAHELNEHYPNFLGAMRHARINDKKLTYDMCNDCVKELLFLCREVSQLYNLPAKNRMPLGEIIISSESDDKNDNSKVSSYTLSLAYYNQWNVETMKKFWATSVNNTSCSEFVPAFIKGLGEQVYNDIFSNGDENANALFSTWEKNNNLIKLGSNINAAQKANDLASEGYLVIAAASGGGSHVAIVGPQSLLYRSYPEKKWAEHFADPFQTGSGFTPHVGTNTPKILYDYPVFLQAGSYTGVVNPGNAFSRKMFDMEQVYFYLYAPGNSKCR